MNTQQTTLKSLADTTFDSVNGYRQAAEMANSPQLKQAFADRSEKRAETLSQLNAELVSQGCDPADGTVAGSLHQTWAEITEMFQNGDEAAVNRVDEGEGYIEEKFEQALESCNFDMPVKQTVQSAYQEIQQGERFADQLENQFD